MFGSELITGNLFNLLEGVLSLIVFASLWRKYQNDGSSSIKYFSMYFLWFAAFQITAGLQYFMTNITPDKIVGLMIMGMAFFYISLAYLPRATMNIYKPEYEMKAFGAILTIAAAVTIYNLLNWTMLGPATPLLVWGSSVLLLAIPFLYIGWKHSSQRWKMWLVALGFTMKAVSGTLISLEILNTVAEFFTFAGLGLIALGLFKGEELSS